MGFAAGSIASTVVLRKVNRDPVDGHPFDWTPDQVSRRGTQLKYGVQWPLTFAFYGAWLGSVVDAGTSWSRADHGLTDVTLAVGPDGVTLGARF